MYVRCAACIGLIVISRDCACAREERESGGEEIVKERERAVKSKKSKE